MEALKAEQLSSTKWRICAIPFGGPLKGGRDTDGEFFSVRTDVKADWFAQRPVLFHHGLDRRLKDAKVGTEGDMVKEDDGWWAEMWLDRQSEYFDQLNALIAAGKMYGSSGTIGHFARTDPKTREILVWPHVEQTLTLTPANVFARITASKAFDDYSSAGLAIESLDGLLADLATVELGSNSARGGSPEDAAALVQALDELDALLHR